MKYLWRDSDAPSDPLEQLIYRSNLLGADSRITNTGGGNTSAKVVARDPKAGDQIDVLWVKGSGSDLRTATHASFASLELEKLRQLRKHYLSHPGRGEKSPVEDQMVTEYRHCIWGENSVPCSIDTPIHAFLPARHIDHTHPHAIIAIAASRRSRELTREIFGEDVGWVRWMRPGFELGLLVQEELREHPQYQGLVMAQHGLISWADNARTCYQRTLSLINRAAEFVDAHDRGNAAFGGRKYPPLTEKDRDALLADLVPWLDQRLAQHNQLFPTIQTNPAMLRFVCSNHAPQLAELGTSCPDHFLRTKIKPLFIRWKPASESIAVLKRKVQDGLATYRANYTTYYESQRRANSPEMRDPNPSVILIPAVGMIAWGRSERESNITAEFYSAAVEVMRGAEAIDEYIALPPREAFDIEYWELEEAKLRRLTASQG